MIKFNNIREFYCIIDMMIGMLTCGDMLKVSVRYSGLIKRYVNGAKEVAQVTDSMAQINAMYDESGFSVNSRVTKGVSKWLSGGTQDKYKYCNGYMIFLDDVIDIQVSDIEYNGDNIIDKISCDGKISIYDISRFICHNSYINDIKINMTNGKKKVSLIYSNDIFFRYVRTNGEYTLYINDKDRYNEMFRDYHICNFMFGSGLPDITSQLDLLQSIALSSNCKFSYNS